MTQHEQGLVAENAALREQLEALQAGKCLHQIQEPMTGQCRFKGHEWGACHPEHVAMVLSNPHEWPDYEVRYLYAAPVLAIVTGPCGQCKDNRQPCSCAINTMLAERGSVAVNREHYLKISKLAKANLAAPAAVAVPEGEVLSALKVIHDTFKADLDAGYITRDKQFAVEIASAALAATPAADASVNVWQQAVDAELASAHLGIAGNVTFMDAAKALNELICWHIEVATNPATNGGKVLAQATGGQALADKEMQLAMQEASSLAQSIFKRHYSDDEQYASGSVVWGLCDSLRGVIYQIDNMTSGLVRAPQADARDAESEYQRGYRHGYNRRDAEVQGALL